MIIKGVWLHNIRSYKDNVIAFPEEGITVIYGDVGSGKSSILSSIGFAIFGNVPGPSNDPLARFAAPTARDLLRRGTSRGFIQLWIRSGGKDIIIHREIQAVGDRATDKGGWVLVIDENKRYSIKKLTATEMRGYILDLLRIPEEKTRARSRVFASAIYIPQFATHSIIAASPEERTEIINRVLNLMKYSLAKNRIDKLRRRIKEEIDRKAEREKELLRDIAIEHEYKRRIKNIKVELKKAVKEKENFESKIASLEELLEKLMKERDELKKTIAELDVKAKRANEIKSKLLVIRSRLKDIDVAKVKERKKEIEKEIEELKRKLEESLKEKENITKELDKLSLQREEKVKLRDKILGELEKAKGQLGSKLSRLKEVEGLERKKLCPVCLQPVTSSHAQELKKKLNNEISRLKGVIDTLSRKLREVSEEINRIMTQERDFKSKIRSMDVIVSQLNTRISELNRKLLKIVEVEQDIKRLEEFQNEYDKLKKEIEERKAIVMKASEVESNIFKVKRQLNETRIGYEKLLQRIAELEKEHKLIEEFLSQIDEKKKQLNEVRELKRKYMLLLDFTRRYILNVISEVERYVKDSAYNAFREEFTRIFKALMTGYENIEVEIKSDFTPVFKVRIDGVYTTVESPSGGQLTSIALAYRLALNRVARSMIPQLREGLLILDEPTYGFSPERVELLRKILFSPGGPKQVIIVTHDRTFYEDTLGGKVKTIRLELNPETTTTKVYYEGIDKEYVDKIKSVMEFARKLVYEYSTKPIKLETEKVTFKPIVKPVVKKEKPPTKPKKPRTLIDFIGSEEK